MQYPFGLQQTGCKHPDASDQWAFTTYSVLPVKITSSIHQ